MATIALVVTDLDRTWLGLPAGLSDELAGCNVLTHTVQRAARIKQVSRVVVVHPPHQNPRPLLPESASGKTIVCHAAEGGLSNAWTQRAACSRKWALHCWRGGLGTATVYDELLPAAPLAEAMRAFKADAALLVRAEWCLFDPDYAQTQLAIHLEHPEAFKISFTQAPPGLSGIVTSRTVLDQFAEHDAGFGQALGYNPRAAHPDPIGREVNHPIPASVRDTYWRFVYDTSRAIAGIRQLASALGEAFATADAAVVTDTWRTIAADQPALQTAFLPQDVALELTPRRPSTGPITPQHHITFERPDLELDLAKQLFTQLADRQAAGDVALTLGGLGDALLHPQWEDFVIAAHDAGVLGIGIETDLLCDRSTLDRLLTLPIDVITVRLNADRSQTYQQVMGHDGFGQVAGNLQYLLQQRAVKAQSDTQRAGLPWIVPSMVKTSETLKDLESFFERWMMFAGHAVIAPAQSGCGLMPEQSPMPMAPPLRRPCRQIGRRMTILSNGQVALCDQDWQGRASLGDAKIESLIDIWQRVQTPCRMHHEERFTELTLCGRCAEWHRP